MRNVGSYAKIEAMDDEGTVTALRFRVHAVEPTTGTPVPAPSLEFTLGGFSCHLDEGVLIARPAESFSSVQAALQTIRPYLRAWQVWSQTADGVSLDIGFTSADRGSTIEGPPPASHLVMTLSRPRPKDPKLQPPPPGIGGASEVIADAARRWREVLEGGESTAAGAFAILTVLEHVHNGRAGVAEALPVDRRLLDQLGRLTATGDTRSGRKVAKSPADRRPLTNKELRWIEGLINRLLLCALAVDVGGSVGAPLTFADYSLDTYHFTVDQEATAHVEGMTG